MVLLIGGGVIKSQMEPVPVAQNSKHMLCSAQIMSSELAINYCPPSYRHMSYESRSRCILSKILSNSSRVGGW